MNQEISSYEQQANAFLSKTGAEIKKEFKKFGSHFNDEETKRNIFEIKIIRNDNVMVFDFGQSLVNSCKNTPKLYASKNEAVEVYAGIRHTRTDISMSVKIQTSLFELKEVHECAKDIKSLYTLDDLKTRAEKCLNEIKAYNKKPNNRFTKLENSWAFKAERLEETLLKSINTKIKELLNEKVLEEQNEQLIAPTNYDILACLTK